MSQDGSNSTLTPHQALIKAQKYCAYQERCQKQVFERLRNWGLNQQEAEEVLVQLMQDNFINEERFSKAYARGKFRIKKWGKNKIIAKLKEFGVGSTCLKAALNEINDADYELTLETEIKKYPKAKTYAQQALLARKMYQKGYESDLIWKAIKKFK